MLTGSCLCGEVEFSFKNPPTNFNICHCKMCQKFHGSAFGPYVWFKDSDFEIVKGHDFEAIYPSSEIGNRSFCKKCGSSLRYIYNVDQKIIFVCAGILNQELPIRPSQHIFVRDKCSWHEICDGLPQANTWMENSSQKRGS